MPVRIPASATLVNIGNRQTCPTRRGIQLVPTNNFIFILGGIVPPPTRLSPRVPFASPAHQGYSHLHCHRTLSSRASNSSSNPMASHVSQPPAAGPAPAASTSPLPGSSSSAAAVVGATEPALAAAGAALGSPPGSNGGGSSPEKSGAGGAAPARADAAAAAVADAVSSGAPSSSPAAIAPDTTRASWASSAAAAAAAASQEETQPTTTVSDNTEAPNHAIPPAPAPPTSTPTVTPLLPGPDEHNNHESKPKEEGQEGGPKTTTINLNGAPTALDSLGPMVIHRDGTVSRIGNWHEMSDIERENTLRVLSKRNQARLKALRGEGGGQGTTEGVSGEKGE